MHATAGEREDDGGPGARVLQSHWSWIRASTRGKPSLDSAPLDLEFNSIWISLSFSFTICQSVLTYSVLAIIFTYKWSQVVRPPGPDHSPGRRCDRTGP